MTSKENGFDLNVRWRFPGGREFAFAFIALFAFLIVIYSNSFRGAWVFDDKPNIVQNSNIVLQSLDWPDIRNTFYGVEGLKTRRPLAYFSFALNHYFGGLDVFGYHLVNFIIHYLSAVFLFLFIYNTLKLPIVRERYGPSSYSIALLAAVFWATSPLQVTAVTYIVQRMASMAGLFYIMAMYFYLKGRMADKPWKQALFWGLCLFSAALSLGTKENAVLIPFCLWLYDLLLIQGATRENVIRNLKIFVPTALIIGAAGLWYADIGGILSGAAYENRPFTLAERLLTQPRIIVFYIMLLIYPNSSWLTLIHDTELSTSLTSPWTTLPALALIAALLVLAGYLARKRPLISFCVFFYFLNHVVESSFIPLELVYEHRNYVPSMLFFVPAATAMVYVIDYFSYKKAVQFAAVALFTFLLFAQGHAVYERNALFAHPLLLWTDNVKKTPTLSRTYNNLGTEYWNLGYYDKAYELFSKAESLDRHVNNRSRAVNLHNLGMYHLYVTREYDRALEYFQAGIKTYPGHLPLYDDAALCSLRKGDTVEAGNLLTAALSRWPQSARLHQTYGLILLKAGDYDRALEEARHALSLDPNNIETLTVLGEAYRKKGHYGPATLCWERYVEKYPDVPEGNVALLELYARQKKKGELSKTIGKLMVLKGSTSWADFIERLTERGDTAAYTPDRDAITAIIKEYPDNTHCR